MTATQIHCSDRQPALYLAFELGWSEWKLALASAPADAPRLRSLAARHTEVVVQEIAKAKQRFGLPDDAPVYCCYEAGRDGFWMVSGCTAGCSARDCTTWWSIPPASKPTGAGGAPRATGSMPPSW